MGTTGCGGMGSRQLNWAAGLEIMQAARAPQCAPNGHQEVLPFGPKAQKAFRSDQDPPQGDSQQDHQWHSQVDPPPKQESQREANRHSLTTTSLVVLGVSMDLVWSGLVWFWFGLGGLGSIYHALTACL